MRPYGDWLKSRAVRLDELPVSPKRTTPLGGANLLIRQRVFGYTQEEIKMIIAPMAQTGQEAVGSMGADTPLAVSKPTSRS